MTFADVWRFTRCDHGVPLDWWCADCSRPMPAGPAYTHTFTPAADDPGPDVTGGAIAWLAAHLTLTAAVAAGLVAVLLLAGLRRVR